MAMVKFGVRRGLFVTDARISPQAKREYLGNYPGMELEFLDRDEVIDEVLSQAALRALWFDGGTIGTVNATVVFPLLVRRHDRDSPLLPLRHASTNADLVQLVQQAQATGQDVAVEIRESWSSREPFEPYRLPRCLSTEEGATSDLRVTEIAFKGSLELQMLPRVAEQVASGIAADISRKFGGVSVIMGRPFITPLEGDHAGLRTVADAPRVAFLGLNGKAVSEAEWFGVAHAGAWSSDCDARTTEVEWVRLYHRPLNAVLSYEITTPIGPTDAVSRQIRRIGWGKSVFALLPKWESWPYADIEEPDDHADWTYEEGRVLCGWIHPVINGQTPVSLSADTGDEELPFKTAFEIEDDGRLAKLRERLSGLESVTLVSPEHARHMLALLTSDPFNEGGQTVCDTAELVVAFDRLSSPIDPLGRSAEIVVAWLMNPSGAAVLGDVGRKLSESLRGTSSVAQADEFFVLTVRVPEIPSLRATQA
jgi:hypothetical protein